MGWPLIFSGKHAKQLNTGGILFKDGTLVENEGVKNYINNFHAEVGLIDWATYDDGAVSEPVDGAGGAPAQVTLTRNISSPLRGSADFDLAKAAADGQGEGIAVNFTIDNADKNKILSVILDYAVGGSFATGDVGVFIYDVTNAKLLSISPDEDLNVGGGKFQGTFLSSDSTSYRLIFHIRTTNASSWDLNLDSVSVGPQIPVFGPAMTDFEDRTSAFTINGAGTPSDVHIVVKRVGDEAIIRGTFRPGTVSGTTASLTLPLDMQVDTSLEKTATGGSNTQTHLAGTFYRDSGSGRFWQSGLGGVIFIDTDDGTKIFFNDESGSTSEFQKDTGSNIWSTSQAVHFEFRIPVAGWSTNVPTAASLPLVEKLWLSAYAGQGSADTAIPHFTNTQEDTTGDLVTVTHDTTNGVVITANKQCIIFGSINGGMNTNGAVGWSLNSTTLSTTILAVAQSERIGFNDQNTSGNQATSPVVVLLSPGDVLRPHTSLIPQGGDATDWVLYINVISASTPFAIQQIATRDRIILDDGTPGHGSTDTRTREYANETIVGTSLSVVTNTTNGSVITVNKSGNYAMTLMDANNSGAGTFGISLNSAQLTTNIQSIAVSDRIGLESTSTASERVQLSTTLFLEAGDKIRVHTDGNSNQTTQAKFIMQRVS